MMKTNVQVKDEPVEFQVEKLLRLYAYQSATKTTRMKTTEQEPSTCAWCQKLGGRSFTLQTENGETKTLCSEVCFNQYRRASFKKNKGSEVDGEQNVSTTKNKPLEKKKREQQIVESNRRKIFIPHRHLTPSNAKTKPNEILRNFSPPSSSSSKRQRSFTPPLSNGKTFRTDQTSLTPSNLPVSLTWQPSLLLPPTIPWSSPIDINRFSYPFLPPPPPPPPSLPIPPSNLFTTLSKGTSSNFTCILPTFIPLPIPIPIPLYLPCSKCSVEVNDQQSQTISEDTSPSRRLSL